MNNIYSLHTFIAFLLHVAVSHSPSSRRNFCPFSLLFYWLRHRKIHTDRPLAPPVGFASNARSPILKKDR